MSCKGEKRKKDKGPPLLEDPGKKGKASKRRERLILVLKEEVEFTRQKALYGKERAGITQGDSRGKKKKPWVGLVVC